MVGFRTFKEMQNWIRDFNRVDKNSESLSPIFFTHPGFKLGFSKTLTRLMKEAKGPVTFLHFDCEICESIWQAFESLGS